MAWNCPTDMPANIKRPPEATSLLCPPGSQAALKTGVPRYPSPRGAGLVACASIPASFRDVRLASPQSCPARGGPASPPSGNPRLCSRAVPQRARARFPGVGGRGPGGEPEANRWAAVRAQDRSAGPPSAPQALAVRLLRGGRGGSANTPTRTLGPAGRVGARGEGGTGHARCGGRGDPGHASGRRS